LITAAETQVKRQRRDKAYALQSSESLRKRGIAVLGIASWLQMPDTNDAGRRRRPPLLETNF